MSQQQEDPFQEGETRVCVQECRERAAQAENTPLHRFHLRRLLNAGGGELYTNVTSGSLTLGCAEKITGIDAKVASGKAHISAPKDTGARVAYSVASGSIKIGLDGRNEKLTGSGSISYGNAEANVNVNVASGSFILDTYTLSE